MKKALKIIMPLLIIGVLMGTTMVRADYGVSVGQIFTFEVPTSNWTVKIGSNSGEGTGFEFEESTVSEGSQFTVEVDAVDASLGVDWTMTVGSKSATGSNSPFDLLGIVLYLFYPLLLSGGFGTWNQTEVELGPPIIPVFFLETDSVSQFFYELSNETYVSSSFTEDEWTFDQIQGHFDNSSTVAVFDWVLEGRYYSSAVNTDYSGIYRFKIAFDRNTGALKGYKMDMDYSGTVEGTILEIQLTQTLQQTNYAMGAFYFGAGGFIPGFEWFIAIPALAILAAIPILIRRKK